jgi:transposase
VGPDVVVSGGQPGAEAERDTCAVVVGAQDVAAFAREDGRGVGCLRPAQILHSDVGSTAARRFDRLEFIDIAPHQQPRVTGTFYVAAGPWDVVDLFVVAWVRREVKRNEGMIVVATGRVSGSLMSGRWGHYRSEEVRPANPLVAECRPDHASEWEAMRSVAQKLGIGTTETVRKWVRRAWVRRAEVDVGARPGVTSDESAELRRLKAEVRKLRRANEALKAAAGFFAAELDRPHRIS